MNPHDVAEVAPVTVAIAGDTAQLDLPIGWAVDPGPPLVALPASWDGDPPGLVVSTERDTLRGETLAAAVAEAALTRLADPVIVSLTIREPSGDHTGDDAWCGDGDQATGGRARDDNGGDDSIASDPTGGDPTGSVEIVVAHQHRGVDVTTVEAHHCRPGPIRWVVGFTVAHPDVARMLPLAKRVVASLRTAP